MGLPSTDWLVRPVAPIDEAGASAVLATRFGVRGTVRDLGSQQDRNYGVRGEAGSTSSRSPTRPHTRPS